MSYGKDLRSAMLPIIYLYWFTGMGVIEHPVGRRRTILGPLYSLFICIINAICTLYSYLSDNQWIWESKSLTVIVFYAVLYGSNFIVVGFIIILSIAFSKKHSQCIRELEAINEIMKEMGVVRCYKRFFISQIWRIGSLVAIMILIMGIATYTEQDVKSYSSITLVFRYYPYFISSVIEILFCNFTNMTTASFEDLNYLVESLGAKQPCDSQNSQNTENEPVQNDVVSSNQRKIEILYSLRKIRTRLACVVKDWNQINAVFILGTIIVATWEFAIHAYLIYTLLSTYGIESIIQIYFVSPLLIIIYYSGKLFLIARSGALLTSEAHRTCGIVLQHLYSIASLKPEAHTFSMQLIQNPLDLSLLGSYTLDYSMLQQISTSVATYVIMAIQSTSSSSADLTQP